MSTDPTRERELYVVIGRRLVEGFQQDPKYPIGECGHHHRTVEAARRMCVPGWRRAGIAYDVCRVAGDLRPVVETHEIPEMEEKRGEVDGIRWTWSRHTRGPLEEQIDMTVSRGDWEMGFFSAPQRTDLGCGISVPQRIRGLSSSFVRGAAWMLARIAERDPTAAAALVMTLNRPIEVTTDDVEPTAGGVVIRGPWAPPTGGEE